MSDRKNPDGQSTTTNGNNSQSQPQKNPSKQQSWGNGIVNPSDITNPDARRWSGSTMSNDMGDGLRQQNGNGLCKQCFLIWSTSS